MVPPMTGSQPGVLNIDGFNLFQNNDGQYIPAYISHVKIPHNSPPQCGMGKTLGENYCLSATTHLRYQGMLYCHIDCYSISVTWAPAVNCDGVARLTFTEDTNP